MGGRQVTVYVHRPRRERQWDRAVTVMLEDVDAENQRALFDRRFVMQGNVAVMEIRAEDPEPMYHVLLQVERWIVAWAEKQGVELVLRWRLFSP